MVDLNGVGIGTTEPALTQQQRSMLGAIWTHLLVHGRWPTFDQIDKQLYRMFDAEVQEILPNIPQGMMYGVPYGVQGRHIEASREIGLTVAAIVELGVGAAELQMFFKLVHLAVDLERSFEPTKPSERPQLTAQRAAQALGLEVDDPSGVLSRLGSILFIEPWGWTSVGEHHGISWSFQIGPEVRKFRRTQTISDYWNIRPKFWEATSPVLQQPSLESDARRDEEPSPRASERMPMADLTQIAVTLALALGGLSLGWNAVRPIACLVGAVAIVGVVRLRRDGIKWASTRIAVFLSLFLGAIALFVFSLFQP